MSAVIGEGAHGPIPLAPLRLTLRGRVVVAILGALVAFGAARGGVAIADAGSQPTVVNVHVVAAGETVWGFASDLASDGQDVRDVVAAIVRLNELASANLTVGQRILLPAAVQ